MAKIFSADYYEFSLSRSNYLLRLLINSVSTFKVFRKNYSVIFVQNPSMALAGLAVFLNTIFGKKLVVDAHNAGILPFDGRFKLLIVINNFILRHADLVIVSNKSLCTGLQRVGVRSVAMPDPLPEVNFPIETIVQSEKMDVFIICSWSDDEPIDLYFAIARRFPDLKIGISGKFTKWVKYRAVSNPDNLTLLGFVAEADYFKHLSDSRIIIDLTTRNDCLVCGAYEAISVGVPIIVSDTDVNREIFSKGVVYTKCNECSLVEALKFALANEVELRSDVSALRHTLTVRENKNRNVILSMLD
ncbi:MAG: hypothetical protein RIK85_11065 [Marinobacter sp.]